MLRRLLGHAVRVDVKDHDGREPLMWAASAGSTDAIVTLVNSGAGVSARDKGIFDSSTQRTGNLDLGRIRRKPVNVSVRPKRGDI